MSKRIRYCLQRDKGAYNAALRIFLRVVQQSLQVHCTGAAKADPASLHRGAVAFIHRFGSSLNTHVHFHVCVVDGMFEALPDAQSDAESPESDNAPSIIFHLAQIDDAAIAEVQAATAHASASVLRCAGAEFATAGGGDGHGAGGATVGANGCGQTCDRDRGRECRCRHDRNSSRSRRRRHSWRPW